MAGWHHQLSGDEFELALGAGDGQGGLVCCGHGVTEPQAQLSNWTGLSTMFLLLCLTYFTQYDPLYVNPCPCKWHFSFFLMAE